MSITTSQPLRLFRWRNVLVPVATGLAGCASINPTLAPARVLPSGTVSVDLGSGYNAPVADSVLRQARTAMERFAAGGDGPQDRDALVRAATVYGQMPPGLAPYGVGRVGLGRNSEAHLGAVGPVMRLGIRREFWDEKKWALSAGIQARAAFWPSVNGNSDVLPGLNVTDARLVGGDASVVVGQTTNGNLYDAWLAIRTGYTHGDGTMSLAQISHGSGFGASLDRLDAAATLGIRVGFGHLSVLAEIETNLGWFWWHSSVGSAGSGFALGLIPAAAISYYFF